MMVATKLRHRELYLEKKATNRKDRLEWRWGKRKLGGRGVGGEGGGEGGGKGSGGGQEFPLHQRWKPQICCLFASPFIHFPYLNPFPFSLFAFISFDIFLNTNE